MPFLTVAGVDLLVEAIEEQQPERIGPSRRSYGGSMRTAVRDEKRSWRLTSIDMSKTDYETFRSAIALGQHVACSGDALPGALTCTVEVTGAVYTRHGVGHKLVPSITLTEV